MVNAAVSGTAILIKNTTDYLDNYSSTASFAANVGVFAAREAGTLGNSFKNFCMFLTQLLLDHTQ